MRSLYIQDAIINYLSDYRKHTLQDIANELEISVRTAQRHVADLSLYYPILVIHGGREQGGVQLEKSHMLGNKFVNNDELQTIVEGLKLLQSSGADVSKLIEKLSPPAQNSKKGG